MRTEIDGLPLVAESIALRDERCRGCPERRQRTASFAVVPDHALALGACGAPQMENTAAVAQRLQ